MPSKALLRPGETLAAARDVPAASPAVTGVVDSAKALAWRNYMTRDWSDAPEEAWIVSVGSDLIGGTAQLTGPRSVEVVETSGAVRQLNATKAVVIATGTTAARPPIPGLADVGAWGSREVTSSKQVPERLIVLGAGAVGTEMAQAWRTIGSKEVTIIEMADRLLPIEEPFVGGVVKTVFEDIGIRVITGAKAVSARRDSSGVTVALDGGGEMIGDELLVAVGLPAGRFVAVNDHLRAEGVDDGSLYGGGGVNGRNLLTHMGKYQARIAGDYILGKDVSAWGDNVASPRGVFTDPQVSAVGKTEHQAREQGINFRAIEMGLGVGAASLLGDNTRGDAKFIVDEDRRRIRPRRHGGHHRPGHPRQPLARRALLPDPQRALAQLPTGIWPLATSARGATLHPLAVNTPVHVPLTLSATFRSR